MSSDRHRKPAVFNRTVFCRTLGCNLMLSLCSQPSSLGLKAPRAPMIIGIISTFTLQSLWISNNKSWYLFNLSISLCITLLSKGYKKSTIAFSWTLQIYLAYLHVYFYQWLGKYPIKVWHWQILLQTSDCVSTNLRQLESRADNKDTNADDILPHRDVSYTMCLPKQNSQTQDYQQFHCLSHKDGNLNFIH